MNNWNSRNKKNKTVYKLLWNRTQFAIFTGKHEYGWFHRNNCYIKWRELYDKKFTYQERLQMKEIGVVQTNPFSGRTEAFGWLYFSEQLYEGYTVVNDRERAFIYAKNCWLFRRCLRNGCYENREIKPCRVSFMLQVIGLISETCM